MGSPNDGVVIGVYDSHQAAEDAVKQFQKAGLDMRKLSIVGKDYHTEEHVVGYYNTGDRMKAWGKIGAFWGGIWGLLFGAAFFAIPGLGPIAVAGPLVGAIVSGLEGAVVVGGLTAIGAGLVSFGVPKDSVIKYETQIKADKFVVICHGTSQELKQAEEIFSATSAKEVESHPVSPSR